MGGPAAVTEIYTLLTACGEDFVLCVIDIDGVPVASGCLITGEADILLYSAGMRQPETRAVAGYFNAAYYLPIEFGYARGARRLLLGPTAVQTKLLRGARVNPVISAVPRACGPLARLLAATDGICGGSWRACVRRTAPLAMSIRARLPQGSKPPVTAVVPPAGRRLEVGTVRAHRPDRGHRPIR
jgi:hypothetical protein